MEDDDLVYEVNPTPETVDSVIDGFEYGEQQTIRAALEKQEGTLITLRVDFDGCVFATFANPTELVKIDWYK